MKEVTCLCGERVVFLDPETVVKTCPNCGNSVYQNGMPQIPQGFKPRKAAMARKRYLLVVGATIAVLMTIAVAAAVMTERQSTFTRAASDVAEGEAAVKNGDYNTALAAYKRALDAYRRWSAGVEVTAPVQAALSGVEAKLARSASFAESAANGSGLLLVALEEIARQAYSGSPESWQETFDREAAGRAFVVRGKVEERSGGAYRASSLTISYRVFTQSGKEVEISFDSPFFERYRLKTGADCIVKAIVARMYLDAGAPGEAGHWVLVASGSKSALVTDSDALRGLGWNVDDEVENLVASQRSLSPAY